MSEIDCPTCGGFGTCWKCDGVPGKVEECDVCGGSGDCPDCDGDGTIEDDGPEEGDPVR